MTAARSALIKCHRRLQAAEETTRNLLPDRLHTLKPDKDWVDAVLEKREAFDAFVAAARRFCSASDPNQQLKQKQSTRAIIEPG